MKTRCLIIDDEHLARTLMVDYCSKMPSLEVVGQCGTATEALDYLKNQPIDLLFLDIQMPLLSGLDMLKGLTHKPSVILTTAYSEYALESYELDVTDYLLKPIGFDRFVKAVNKVHARTSKQESTSVDSNTSEKQDLAQHFFIKSGSKKVKVAVDDILYVEGLREYVKYVTKDRFVVALESMKNLEEELEPYQFIRVHKSFIVSLNKVDAVTSNSLEIGGKSIPIGKSYKDQVLTYF